MSPERTSAGKLSHWFIGLILVATTIAGFAVASHSAGTAAYYGGMAAGLISLLGIFLLIKRGFDAGAVH